MSCLFIVKPTAGWDDTGTMQFYLRFILVPLPYGVGGGGGLDYWLLDHIYINRTLLYLNRH